MKNISEHISFREAVHSNTAIRHGIDNMPNDKQIGKMIIVAEAVFEPLREGLGSRPININSFFRCPDLNKIEKGSKTSQHPKGEAMDIDNDNSQYGPTNIEIFEFIRDNLEFDQLIWEEGDDKSPAWVHVSYCDHNRRQILRSINRKYKLL